MEENLTKEQLKKEDEEKLKSLKNKKFKTSISIDSKIYEEMKNEFTGESFSSSIEKLFSEYKDLKEKIKNYDFKFLGELKFNQGIILNMLNSISLGNSGEIYFGDREKRVSENFEKAKECEIEKQAEEKNIRIRNSRNDW
ncbi:hypothetical protein [Parvimonas parva]|uniref:Uncharacterized protein n=1 Tax=Parvimonas parva TaxID=2769485 RepID=A0ABS1C969_9FIRM|nr:hypothetical protein [Parvimonas parva]MBK1468637.1 hypothetical protein [Parvimonas parva]